MSDALHALKQAGLPHRWQRSGLQEDLETFRTLLIKWQEVQNLVSRETLSDFWQRHVADSLQILPLIDDLPAPHIVDLGSGGGFPALPLAIAAKSRPFMFSLIESNSRKCAFLRAVARELGLSVHVFNNRIDSDVSRETGAADIITARALAPLPVLLGYAANFWQEGTKALLHKGREHVEEIEQAGAVWAFDVVISESMVENSGVVLQISNLRPKVG